MPLNPVKTDPEDICKNLLAIRQTTPPDPQHNQLRSHEQYGQRPAGPWCISSHGDCKGDVWGNRQRTGQLPGWVHRRPLQDLCTGDRTLSVDIGDSYARNTREP